MEAAAIILPMIAGGIGAVGTLVEGNYENQAAKYEAKQLDQKGDQELALAAQEAKAKRREAMLANSRNLAVAAGSGGAADDPTVLQIMGDTEAEGQFNSLMEMYKGFSRRSDLMEEANSRRQAGRNARTAGRIGAVGTLLQGSSSGLGRIPSLR